MENKTSRLDKAVKISIIAGALIVALSVAYYFIVFIPNKENYKQTQEKKIEEKRSYCNQWAIDKAKNQNLIIGGSNDKYRENIYIGYFERCLREQGLSN